MKEIEIEIGSDSGVFDIEAQVKYDTPFSFQELGLFEKVQ